MRGHYFCVPLASTVFDRYDCVAMNPVPRRARLFVRVLLPLFDHLLANGLDKAALRHECGIDLDAADFSQHAVDPIEAGELLTRLMHLTGRTDLGFEAGLSIKPTMLGLFGFAAISCRNYDHAYQLQARYLHLLTDLVTIRYQRQGGHGDALASITPLTSMPPVLLRFVIEAAAVGSHQQMQLILGAPMPAYDLHVVMQAPPHHARYASLAPARVRFVDSAVPGVTAYLPAALVDRPLPMASARVLAEIESQLQAQTRRLPVGTHWGDYVLSMLRESQGQFPTIDDLAQRLGVNVRTIDRHLAAEGLSFRDMARGVRIERARELLRRPGMTVAQVADALGFGDAASFSRAFRRGAGMPPGEYQRWARSER